MVKILVTGGAGQLGHEFNALPTDTNLQINILPHSQLDIVNAQQTEQVIIDYQADFVVNCAAFTDVDKAETESKTAFAVNCDGPANLAKICAQAKIPLLHISTDYVFDGKQQIPYRETDATHPINQYGMSKLAGEIAIREQHAEHIILRTSSVFGMHGKNFVKTIWKRVHLQDNLLVIADKIACPTPASTIARTILQIIKNINNGNRAWGIYHYCGGPPLNWYHFAQIITQMIELKEPANKLAVVMPTDSTAFSGIAPRPIFSALDCSKIQLEFGIEPCLWQPELDKMLDQLKTS